LLVFSPLGNGTAAVEGIDKGVEIGSIVADGIQV
jgi:hypothetical protein